jgi:hypothetical protein
MGGGGPYPSSSPFDLPVTPAMASFVNTDRYEYPEAVANIVYKYNPIQTRPEELRQRGGGGGGINSVVDNIKMGVDDLLVRRKTR